MKRNVLALAVVSSLAAGVVTSANAMSTELNMLTGAVFNELVSRGIATDNINTLTLGQLALIKAQIDSDDSEAEKTRRIQAIVER